MKVKDIIKNEKDNCIDSPPPPIQKAELKDNLGYNCTECSSLIEIISIDEENIDFKCLNNHNKKLKINFYLEQMKKYSNNKNLNNKCEKHNYKEYIIYCFDCKYHICNDCLKSKEHKNHNKIYLDEEKPNEDHINKIKTIIKYYENKIDNIKENQIKEKINEFNNNIVKENNRVEKLMNINKFKKEKELNVIKDKYLYDLLSIKRKYEKEIKERKNKYVEEKNQIFNKYKVIFNKEMIMHKNKKRELEIKYKFTESGKPSINGLRMNHIHVSYRTQAERNMIIL